MCLWIRDVSRPSFGSAKAHTRLWIRDVSRPSFGSAKARSQTPKSPRRRCGGGRGGMVKNAARRRRRRWAKAGGWWEAAAKPAPPDGDGANGRGKARRKKLTKRDMKNQAFGSWIPDVNGGPAYLGTRVAAIIEAEAAMVRVAEMNQETFMNVNQLPDNETSFTLKTNCTVEEYGQFLEELRLHSLRIAPFTVTVVIDGVPVQVPVTPMMPPNVEEFTYHTIILRRPDGAEIHLLVEDCSGYIKAFKLVYPHEIASDKTWNRLGTDPLNSRYTPSEQTDYGDGYGSLVDVYVNSGIFLVMFDFFASFDNNPTQRSTPKGRRILYTSYIAFGETPRFPMAKLWVDEGLLWWPNLYHYLPSGLSGLIHDWGVLSRVVFRLYLALQDQRLVNLVPDALQSMVTARLAWRDAQVKHKDYIQFFHKEEDIPDEETPIYMEDVCGTQVTLLRHDYLIWNKVRLRLANYTGYFPDDIEAAYGTGKLT